jgi:molybdate transport system substrate-binding protein
MPDCPLGAASRRLAVKLALVVVVAALAVALPLGSPRAQEATAPTIAAASDLKFTLEEVAVRFKADTGLEVRLAFGSSGNFARQIEQGAPFEMFLSADEGFVFRLANAGLTADRGTLYAEGRVVLFTPLGSPLRADARLADLRAALADGRIKRFAIANPEHAPYGRAAEEALRHRGLWEAVRPSLVLGENVSQAAQFASSGSAEGGIIAYSLALAPELSKLGSYALIPAEWHRPLNQRMVLLKGAGDTARRFYEYVQGRSAREVLIRYGFVLPGETS